MKPDNEYDCESNLKHIILIKKNCIYAENGPKAGLLQ